MTQFKLTLGGKSKRSRFAQFTREVTWDKLPDISQQFIIEYGLRQYLSDGMAGAETEADAISGVDARLDNLTSGEFKRRGAGADKPDTVDSRALKNARQFIRDQLKAQNKTATKEQIAAGAQKMIEANDSWRKEAQKQLDAEAKAREAAANEDNAAILADLLAEIDTDEEEEEEADD